MSARAAGQVRLTGVGQVALTVRDVARAAAFYRDVLGMRLLFEVPGAAFFDCGGMRLMLGAAEAPDAERFNSLLYYRVDDLRDTHEALSAHGVAFEQPPHLVAHLPDHDLWMAFLRDTEGTLLALMSEVRPPAAGGQSVPAPGQ